MSLECALTTIKRKMLMREEFWKICQETNISQFWSPSLDAIRSKLMKSYQERTAFTVGALGLYEFKSMPFGHSNSPATYQRLMEDCLDDLNLNSCFIFLVDHIVFSKTLDEHLLRLQLAN